jgi:hypothetical protein
VDISGFGAALKADTERMKRETIQAFAKRLTEGYMYSVGYGKACDILCDIKETDRGVICRQDGIARDCPIRKLAELKEGK